MILRSTSHGNDSSLRARTALTLLEVVVAMLIFLGSLLVIYPLISMGERNALDVQMQSRASMLCQSKLAEVIIGEQDSGEGSFAEEPDWLWQVDRTDADVEGLWSIRVRVFRETGDGRLFEAKLSQMVLNPSLRGSTQIRVTGSSSSASESSSSSSNSSSSNSSSSSSSTEGKSP